MTARRSAILLAAAVLACGAGCSRKTADRPEAVAEQVEGGSMDQTYENVEAACGQCQFGLSGEGCDLAVRIDGEAYFVEGTHIDEHGDAHAADGFCNAIRRAAVVGHVAGGRFLVRSFRLLSEENP